MEDLQDRRRAAALGRHRELSQTGDETIVVCGEFAREADAIRLNMRAAGDDQADVPGAKAVIGVLLIGDGAIVVAGPGRHRGHRHAVAQDQARCERQRLEQLAVFHVHTV
jgi:hypothetical protein